MKKTILSLILLALIAVVGTRAEAVFKVVGGQAACDTTLLGCSSIPLTPTTLCSASCNKLSSLSFTSTSRFWGGGSDCNTSSDGGLTWANCTTQPFTSGGIELYVGASDGSVIGSAQLAGVCTIKRSTDNGSNWTTVFTDGAIGCGGAVSGGTRIKCLSDGQCNFIFRNTVTATPRLLASTDNGQNWTLTTVGAAAITPVSLAWDGSVGIATANGDRSEKYAGSWTQGTAAFAGCGGFISGSVIYNGVPYGLCKEAGALSENYRMMTADGALFKTVTLPGAFPGAGTASLAYSLKTDQLYFVAGVDTTPQVAIGVWVSLDDGVTFVKIYESATSTNGMTNASDIFFSNGCIYFSGGTTPVFTKIC
jgi:hypothetical protein